MLAVWLSANLSLLSAIPLRADAPAATATSPAGGQRGTTIECRMVGKTGTAPLQGWCSREGVTFEFPEKGETFKLTIPETAEPGLGWIRIFNAEGSTELLPIQIGVIPEISETEPNNAVSEAGRIESLPVTVNGVLHRGGEVDTFAVPLKQGQTLVASLAAHEVLGSPVDAVLQLLTSDGFVIEQNHDHHGEDPQIVFTALADATYLVRVFAFPSEPDSSIAFFGGDRSVYRLTLTTGGFISHVLPPQGEAAQPTAVGWNLQKEDAPEVTPGLHHQLSPRLTGEESKRRSEAVGVLERGTSVIGSLAAAGETDSFEFTATKGETLRFAVAARRIGSPLDPVLAIQNAEGKTIVEFDDIARTNPDIATNWKVTADGTYKAVLRDRFGHTGTHYWYELTCDLDQPRYEATVAADRFTLKPGTDLEIPVTISRLAGFKEELTVTAVDLPEGVEVVPATSAGDGATAKEVKLVLKIAESAGSQQPFHITLRSTKEGAPEQTATASTRVPEVRSSSLWLTVTASKKP